MIRLMKLVRGIFMSVSGIGILLGCDEYFEKLEKLDLNSGLMTNMFIAIILLIAIDYSISNVLVREIEKENSAILLPWILMKCLYTAIFTLWTCYNAIFHLNTESITELSTLFFGFLLIAIGIFYCVSLFKVYMRLRLPENKRGNNKEIYQHADEMYDEQIDEENDDDYAIWENECYND